MAARNIIKLGALEAPRTAFLLCDIQETFRPHVKHFGEVVKVANKMLEAAKHFKIPVYISEQYPKGLGHTTKDIKVEDAAMVYEKTKFSMYTPELQERLKKDVPDLASVVLFGIEAHVCIEQTVIDLLSENINVHILADGVSSRSLMDRGLALQIFLALASAACALSIIRPPFIPRPPIPSREENTATAVASNGGKAAAAAGQNSQAVINNNSASGGPAQPSSSPSGIVPKPNYVNNNAAAIASNGGQSAAAAGEGATAAINEDTPLERSLPVPPGIYPPPRPTSEVNTATAIASDGASAAAAAGDDSLAVINDD